MATHCIAQLTFRYQGVRSPVVARFDVPHASSDGGLVLLKAVDERLRLTEAVAQCVSDPRQPGKVAHSILDLVRHESLAWRRAISMATTPPGSPPTRCTSGSSTASR
jgi:Transposase DDE domain group 1